MRISDWSSDVCSSDLADHRDAAPALRPLDQGSVCAGSAAHSEPVRPARLQSSSFPAHRRARAPARSHHVSAIPAQPGPDGPHPAARSEEHTSELQSLMRISYAVFCLKKTTHQYHTMNSIHNERLETA